MTNTQLTRRTILWSVPAVTVAAAAPAYATSTEPALQCAPVGCKRPGVGGNTKDYFLESISCSQDLTPLSVLIGTKAAEKGEHGWAIYGQGDSEAKLPVQIVFEGGATWSGEVKFNPCKVL